MQRIAKLIFIFCLLAINSNGQHLPRFSWYDLAPSMYNPAVTGAYDQVKFTLLNRNQWDALPDGPKSGAIVLHTPLAGQKMGIGLSMLVHRSGPAQINETMFSYAYRVRLGKGKLSLGLGLGARVYQPGVTAEDYRLTGEAISQSRYGSAAFDFGFRYHTHKWYADLSLRRLDQSAFDIIPELPEQAQVRSAYDAWLIIAGGYHFDLGNEVVFTPSMMFMQDRGQVNWFQVSATTHFKKKYWVSVGFMQRRGVSLGARFKAGKKVILGYAYDRAATGHIAALGGSHEIVLDWAIDWQKSPMSNPKAAVQ